MYMYHMLFSDSRPIAQAVEDEVAQEMRWSSACPGRQRVSRDDLPNPSRQLGWSTLVVLLMTKNMNAATGWQLLVLEHGSRV